MRIGVIGAGHFGGNCAHQAVKAGDEVMLSFARNVLRLESLPSELSHKESGLSVTSTKCTPCAVSSS